MKLQMLTINELSELQQQAADERDFELFNQIEVEINARFSPDSYFVDFMKDLL